MPTLSTFSFLWLTSLLAAVCIALPLVYYHRGTLRTVGLVFGGGCLMVFAGCDWHLSRALSGLTAPSAAYATFLPPLHAR